MMAPITYVDLPPVFDHFGCLGTPDARRPLGPHAPRGGGGGPRRPAVRAPGAPPAATPASSWRSDEILLAGFLAGPWTRWQAYPPRTIPAGQNSSSAPFGD